LTARGGMDRIASSVDFIVYINTGSDFVANIDTSKDFGMEINIRENITLNLG
jgi:hypothetical protein